MYGVQIMVVMDIYLQNIHFLLLIKVKKCNYCGGREHDITTCWNISEIRTMVADNNNQPWPNKNANKTPYSVTLK
jgi:hypothetical protein